MEHQQLLVNACIAGECNPSPKIGLMATAWQCSQCQTTYNRYVLGTGQVGAVVPAFFVCFCTAGNAQSELFKQGTYCTTEAKPDLKCCTV